MKLNMGITNEDLQIEKDLRILCNKLHNAIHQDPYGKIEVTVAHDKFPSKANDIVGKCVEEWISHWFIKNNAIHNLRLFPNTESQEFPDYKAVIGNKVHPMDIKCFDDRSSTGKPSGPGFDIGNFDSFFSKSDDSAKAKILADYLVFAYHPEDVGFKFDGIKLMRIWQMVGVYKINNKYTNRKYNVNKQLDVSYPKLYQRISKINNKLVSRSNPISIQVKKNRPYAVRPMNFISKKAVNNQLMYQSPAIFLDKMAETRLEFNSSDPDIYKPQIWLNKVNKETKPYINFMKQHKLL